MTCAANRELLSAYVDGELPPDRAAAIAGHLTTCADCAREYEATLRTVRTLREGLVRYRAPDVLRARIHGALREDQVDDAPAARRSWRVPWRSLAAGVAIAAASSTLTVFATSRGASGRAIPEEVLASHVRSLMPAHLTDVQSNDQHNVKPWFNGRVDFSPVVPRLDSAGFPLLGGRVDYVRGRPVAVVVYGRRLHVINVFSWPADAERDASPSRDTRHGYNLLHWRTGGLEYWVVSDLNADELEEFATLLRRAAPPPGAAASGP